ncbi:MAG: class E sortase [Nitriliruptoraceae bacterium]
MGDRWLVGWLLVGGSIIVAAGVAAGVAMPAPAAISSRSGAHGPVYDTRLADQSAWRSIGSVAANAGEQTGPLGRRHFASTLEIADPAVRERSTMDTAVPAGSRHHAGPGDQVADDYPSAIRHLWFERDGEPIVVPAPLEVGSDVEAASLRYGPGHYPSTALAGQSGNIGIAGHRTTFGAPFDAIDQLVASDTVHLRDEYGREWIYTFVASAVVDPDEVWVLSGDALGIGRDLVTLTTCHPRFSAARRLVVWAELVGGR